jgi:transmembrane sensor
MFKKSTMSLAETIEHVRWRRRGERHVLRWAAVVAAIVVPLILLRVYLQQREKQDRNSRRQDILRLAANCKAQYKAVMYSGAGDSLRLDELPIHTVMENKGYRWIRTGIRSFRILSMPGPGTDEPMSWSALVCIPYGQQWQLTLPDGTLVDLASGSSLAVLVTGQGRHLRLDGQAYFQAIRNAAVPLSISTRHFDVAVLGTTFTIEDYANEGSFSATLIHGKISVSKNAAQITLKEGEEARMDTTSDGIQIVANVDTTDRLIWKRPYFEITDLSLPEVLQQVQRWYGMNNTIYRAGVDTVSKGLLGGGHIGKDIPLGELLRRFDIKGQLSFDIRKSTIVVSPY